MEKVHCQLCGEEIKPTEDGFVHVYKKDGKEICHPCAFPEDYAFLGPGDGRIYIKGARAKP